MVDDSQACSTHELIHKQFPLTDTEKQAAEDSGKFNGVLMKFPQPVLEFIIRRSLKKMRDTSFTIKLPTVNITNRIIKEEYKSDVGSGSYSVYFYRRAELPEGKHPLFYFIHGGGFLGGTHLANENLMRKLTDENDVVCASADYHVAPEARFPVALRECERGLLNLVESAGASYIDKSRVYIAGDSAGGNLAAAAVLSLKKQRGFVPAGQILLYPVTEMYKLDTKSYKQKGLEFFSMRRLILISRKLYANNAKDYNTIYFSPLLATGEDDPCPTRALILLAGRDGLLDDGVLYGEHLHKLGGAVKTIVYDNAFHAFANGLGDSPTAEDAYKEIAEFILDDL
ncbi:MAG: alpha/beta hydrolase [Syntrophomonadaceae bacterium]|jgi:acetyl esterase|nr:alpha/beta hydrolase [Syntrophomonadaceae bacterium]